MKKRRIRRSTDGAAGFNWTMGWRAAAGILWLVWIVAMGFLAASFPHALEETDEASYVLASANPWASPGWGIFFGYGLHPLWQAGGACVLGFRWAGLLALMAMVYLFVRALCDHAQKLRSDLLAARTWLVLPSLGLAALMTYTRGMRAPGYDWLLVEGGLCFAAGWICVEASTKSGAKNPGAFLVATGLALVSIAKWTVLPGFVALGLVLLIWQKREGRIACSWARWSLAWLLVWLAGFVLYAGPTGIQQTIQAGWSQTLTGSHDGLGSSYLYWLFQFLWVTLRAWLWVAGFFAAIWLGLRVLQGRAPALEDVAGYTYLAFLALAFLKGHWQGGEQSFSKGKMLMATWLAGLYFLTWRFRHPKKLRPGEQIPPASRRIIWLLCLLPFLTGIGTATGLANYINHGAVFFVAAGWIWLAQAHRAGLRPWLVVVPIVVLALIQAARTATTPWNTYRIGPVWGQTTPVRTGPEKGRLHLSEQAVQRLELLSRTMKKAGYHEGDPVVGLSSLCNLVYLLGGTSPGVCWYMDKPGPGTGSSANLANIPPDVLASAWLILLDEDPSFPTVREFWPSRKVSLPRRLSGEFLWPMGDGDGIPRKISIYQPRSL